MTTPSLPDTPCYLNGEFTPLKDAKISVLDRGFIFGDGVYEVVPAYGGRLFRFEQHMARLARSLTELRIPNPMTQAEWQAVALKLVAAHAQSTGAPAEQGNSWSTSRSAAASRCATTPCCPASRPPCS